LLWFKETGKILKWFGTKFDNLCKSSKLNF
jgi:hypothetical protein